MCIEIHTRGAIFLPHLNSDPININTNLNPNPNPNYPNHSYTPRVETAWSRSNYPFLRTHNIFYGG